MSGERTEVEAVVQAYLDGLYHCDVQALARVFHPQAIYATASGAEPLLLRLDEYLPIVAQRDPPSRTVAPRDEALLSVDFAGPVTAMVKLRCRFFGKDYIDFLTLIRVQQRWQIVAKVFHFEPAA